MPIGAKVDEKSRPSQCPDCGEFTLQMSAVRSDTIEVRMIDVVGISPGEPIVTWTCTTCGCQEEAPLEQRPERRFNYMERIRFYRGQVADLEQQNANLLADREQIEAQERYDADWGSP